jgi:exodeoxyribonuclease V alpha subunit
MSDTIELNAELESVDRRVAHEILRGWPHVNPLVSDTVATLHKEIRQGHAYLDLNEHAVDLIDVFKHWSAVGIGMDGKPLVLDSKGRLYLHRYWQYEQQLAAALVQRSAAPSCSYLKQHVETVLSRLMPNIEQFDLQRHAVEQSLGCRLSIIVGGPGTGKTWTVLRLIASEIELRGDDSVRVAIAAPTGKAAARMTEAIQQGLNQLDMDEKLKRNIPKFATTLHQLLGASKDLSQFRFHSKAPLGLDYLVIDECSMVDLAMMVRVLEALPETASLVLLGDPDQLASIEIGSVLAELRQLPTRLITKSNNTTNVPVVQRMFELKHARRFDAQGTLALALEAVREGDISKWQSALKTSDALRIVNPAPAQRLSQIAEAAELQKHTNLDEAFKALSQCSILTALREGDFGVSGINTYVRKAIGYGRLLGGQFLQGEPIMLLRHLPRRQLVNGDIGIAWINNNEWGVMFEKGQGERFFVPATELPIHQSAWAMTVHKAQGSEFERVVIILPDQIYPLMSREWLYTALSRARKSALIVGRDGIVESVFAQSAKRRSGLADAILNLNFPLNTSNSD